MLAAKMSNADTMILFIWTSFLKSFFTAENAEKYKNLFFKKLLSVSALTGKILILGIRQGRFQESSRFFHCCPLSKGEMVE